MMSETIRIQQTPNPNAIKITLGRLVAPGTGRTFTAPQEACNDPVARALLGIDGVKSVFMLNDFITVTKAGSANWDDLTPKILSVISGHLSG